MTCAHSHAHSLLALPRPPGGASLRASLQPVRPADGGPGVQLVRPAPRFAHATGVLERGGRAEMLVVGGVNHAEDLSDVFVWLDDV